MNSTLGIRLTAAIVVCMSWSLPARGQETALPTERTAASSASPVAAAGAILDVTQAANWAYRNRGVLSIAAAGTAQDNTAPQAEPSPQGAPARPRLHAPVKRRKPWTKARIAVLGIGIGATGAGAYLWAKAPTITPAGTTCVSSYNPFGVPNYASCSGPTIWSGKKKAGLGLTIIGASVSILALAW